MSANKVKHEFRTILNIGSDYTRNKVHQILRETKFQAKELIGSIPIYIGNQIDIGMYIIRLEFSLQKIETTNTRLRDYGKFNIRIFEKSPLKTKEINLSKHSIFNKKDWVQRNLEKKIGINDLVEAIILCRRLERLKAFN